MVSSRVRAAAIAPLAALLLLAPAGCEPPVPQAEPLVVEAFIETGRPLPPVLVHRTAPLSAAPATAVTNASVSLRIGEEEVPFEADTFQPGRYLPLLAYPPPAGAPLHLTVRTAGDLAEGVSLAPPTITLDSVRIEPAAGAVRAAYAPAPGAPVQEGFLFPVDVRIFWTPAGGSDTNWWVRARLQPPPGSPAAAVDLLLRLDTTRPEGEFVTAEPAIRVWHGLYALPVASEDDPLPAHTLDVAVLRSGLDYALYALSRADPGPGGPVGNVTGGLGIVAGISVDRASRAVGP